jgi:hypothetical protein
VFGFLSDDDAGSAGPAGLTPTTRTGIPANAPLLPTPFQGIVRNGGK